MHPIFDGEFNLDCIINQMRLKPMPAFESMNTRPLFRLVLSLFVFFSADLFVYFTLEIFKSHLGIQNAARDGASLQLECVSMGEPVSRSAVFALYSHIFI